MLKRADLNSACGRYKKTAKAIQTCFGSSNRGFFFDRRKLLAHDCG